MYKRICSVFCVDQEIVAYIRTYLQYSMALCARALPSAGNPAGKMPILGFHTPAPPKNKSKNPPPKRGTHTRGHA